MTLPLTTIGRAEKVDLPDLHLSAVPAKVDTGADSSTIWASQVSEQPDGLHVVFFGKGHPKYTGEVKVFKQYTTTMVENSFGQKELRYKIKLRISVRSRLIRATFTLSDRQTKTYPILLGHRLLRGKFLVDVSDGELLHQKEKRKAQKLRESIKRLNEGA